MIKRIIKGIVSWAFGNNKNLPYEDPQAVPRIWPISSRKGLNKASTVASAPDELEFARGMDFRIYKAVGGTIIQTLYPDPVKDTMRTTLYVVTDEQNLGEEIAQIITRESLSR